MYKLMSRSLSDSWQEVDAPESDCEKDGDEMLLAVSGAAADIPAEAAPGEDAVGSDEEFEVVLSPTDWEEMQAQLAKEEEDLDAMVLFDPNAETVPLSTLLEMKGEKPLEMSGVNAGAGASEKEDVVPAAAHSGTPDLSAFVGLGEQLFTGSLSKIELIVQRVDKVRSSGVIGKGKRVVNGFLPRKKTRKPFTSLTADKQRAVVIAYKAIVKALGDARLGRLRKEFEGSRAQLKERHILSDSQIETIRRKLAEAETQLTSQLASYTKYIPEERRSEAEKV